LAQENAIRKIQANQKVLELNGFCFNQVLVYAHEINLLGKNVKNYKHNAPGGHSRNLPKSKQSQN
jgi:hypothetical protein